MKYYDVSSDLNVATSGLMKGVYLPSVVPHLHRHGEIEINVLERGSVMYIFGSTRQVVRRGEIALFWASIPHQIIQSEDSTILHWLNIPFDIFLQWQLPHTIAQKVVSGTFISGTLEMAEKTTLPLFKQWGKDLDNRSPDYDKIVLLEAEAFLRRFAVSTMMTEVERKENPEEITPHYKLSKIEQMATFIAEHYTEPLRVQDVAGIVHLHPNYAMRLFRQYFDMSITDYITQYRLAHAKRFLITSDQGILEIAMAAGFGSSSNFYTIFKHACGLSPRAYRTTYRLKKQRE